jgi:hypothetical protein
MCCSRPNKGDGKRRNCGPCPVPGAAGGPDPGAAGAAGGPDPGAAGAAGGPDPGPTSATQFNAAYLRHLGGIDATTRAGAVARAGEPVIPVGKVPDLSPAQQHTLSGLLGPLLHDDSKGAIAVAGKGGPFDPTEMRRASWESDPSSVRKSLEEELENITPEHLILRAERLGVPRPAIKLQGESDEKHKKRIINIVLQATVDLIETALFTEVSTSQPPAALSAELAALDSPELKGRAEAIGVDEDALGETEDTTVIIELIVARTAALAAARTALLALKNTDNMDKVAVDAEIEGLYKPLEDAGLLDPPQKFPVDDFRPGAIPNMKLIGNMELYRALNLKKRQLMPNIKQNQCGDEHDEERLFEELEKVYNPKSKPIIINDAPFVHIAVLVEEKAKLAGMEIEQLEERATKIMKMAPPYRGVRSGAGGLSHEEDLQTMLGEFKGQNKEYYINFITSSTWDRMKLFGWTEGKNIEDYFTALPASQPPDSQPPEGNQNKIFIDGAADGGGRLGFVLKIWDKDKTDAENMDHLGTNIPGFAIIRFEQIDRPEGGGDIGRELRGDKNPSGTRWLVPPKV